MSNQEEAVKCGVDTTTAESSNSNTFDKGDDATAADSTTGNKEPTEKSDAAISNQQKALNPSDAGTKESSNSDCSSKDAAADAADSTTVASSNISQEPPNTCDVSTLEQKIIRQVEYYFGDANLSRDKFLNEEIKKDEGWVPLSTLLTFNRLKALSEDAAVVMNALKKSTNDLLELKSDDSAIRRHPTKPIPSADEVKQEMQKRLLYVKGFPTDQTLDDLIEYFDKYGGESVNLRRDAKHNFKGSVFILFKTAEQAKEYLEAPDMKYKDTTLVERLYKHDYYKKKQDEKLGFRQEEIKKKEEMKKQKEKEEKEELQSKMTRGAVLKVIGIDEGTKMEKIKEFFGAFGKIAWVDFERGENHALIRFATENEAEDAWKKAQDAGEDGKVLLNDKELTATVIEGDEEEAHWKKVFESIHNRFRGNKKQFGKGQRGGYRGQKRRSADNSETGGAVKKAKTD